VADELDAETIEFAHRMFDLARSAFVDLPEMAEMLAGHGA
jgi:hypothetical protein